VLADEWCLYVVRGLRHGDITATSPPGAIMNSNKKHWAVNATIGFAMSCLPVLAQAENDISPSSEPSVSTISTPANWEIREHAEMKATELISRLAQGSFSTMCSDGTCGVFVEPLAGCVPGAKYPLLIN
jgi:hypothetical protein